jgi:molecular chaperone HscB
LLGLTPAFSIDTKALEEAYIDIQRRVHPDRFASGDSLGQREAAQWAALANDAYRTLRQPARRAHYLVTRHGIDLETCTLPEGFLFTQLELREKVANARAERDATTLNQVKASLDKEAVALHESLARHIDAEGDYKRAAQTVLVLQFYARLVADLEDALLETEA